MEYWKKLQIYRAHNAARREKRRTSGYRSMFQRWLRNFIHELEMTRNEAADFFGVRRMTLDNWLHGLNLPSYKSMAQIIDVLGYDWEDMEEILRNGRRSQTHASA